MAGPISTIVSAISAEVVAVLGAMTPAIVLPEGGILVGPQQRKIHTSPPRILLVPDESPFGPKNLMNPPTIAGSQRAINQQRSLMSEWLTFTCWCWGASPTRNDAASQADDYDVARLLYQTVLAAIYHNLGPIVTSGDKGIVRASSVRWNDDDASVTRLGREAYFAFSVSTPVLDNPALAYPTNDVGRTGSGVTYGNDTPVPVT